jgi:hypothetical protein
VRSEVWLPIVTLVLGYVGTLFTEGRRDARARRIAEESRLSDRADAQQQRQESFELEALTRALTTLQDFARAVSRAHIVDSMTARETGVYAGTLLSEEDNDHLFRANVAFGAATSLVLDDDVRAALERAGEAGNAVSLMLRSTVPQAEQRFLDFLDRALEARSLAAERLRGIYKGTVTTP